ncbi:MAG: AMP-binding protein [Alcanivorax sp.]
MSLIIDAIRNNPADSIALVGDNHSLTYGELSEKINAYADALFDVQTLGIALDNGIEWVLWDLAAVHANVPSIPIPPFFTQEQVFHSLQASGASHLLTSEGMRSLGGGAKSVLPHGTAKVTFTSGTTGTPKGVCLSQNGMENVAHSLTEILDNEYAQKHLSILPMAVLLENIAGVYATLLAGGTVYIPSLKTIGFSNPFQPDFQTLAYYMKTYEITSAILVPELLRGLMAARVELPDLKFLAVGGSKSSPTLISSARQCGFPVYEGYGLSECASVVSLNTPENDKIGSVGKVLPHIELTECDGEITIKNPAFLGYLGQEHDGEFSTGDLGHLDADGYLTIDGRKKNVLITSYGRNISPEWVESQLLLCPEIAQAIVYGDAEPFLSALIVPMSHDTDLASAIDRTNATLPEYAHIKNFSPVAPFTVADGTLTGTGRPKREIILSKYQTQKENENELLRSTC